MDARLRLRRALLGRQVAIAFAVVGGLYFVRGVRFQPLQIPAYLLIAAYDLVELSLPALGPYHPIGFPLFLYGLAVIAAGVTRWLRPGDGARPWRRTIGGVAVVVGLLSLAFGAFIGGPLVSPTDNPTPLAVTGATAIVLLLGGWLVLGRPLGDVARR